MKKWNFQTFSTTLCTMLLMASSTAATADNTQSNQSSRHSRPSCKDCITTPELKCEFRKWEAFQIVQDITSQVSGALDSILSAPSPDSDQFQNNLQFILSLQLDPEYMDITIDDTSITNAEDFEDALIDLNGLFAWRRSWTSEWILDEGSYKDENCLRQITAYAIGQNFASVNTDSVPSNHPYFTSDPSTYYGTNNVRLTLQELPPEAGKGCAYNFRIVSIDLVTTAIIQFPADTMTYILTIPPPQFPLTICPPLAIG